MDDSRRGAAFGSILAAFDTGIGTGSVTTGWIAQHAGLPHRLRVRGGPLATLALPFFLITEKRLLRPARTPAEPAIG